MTIFFRDRVSANLSEQHHHSISLPCDLICIRIFIVTNVLCPSVENVLAAEWLWIKPLSLQPYHLPMRSHLFVWQVNVSWLSSEIFLHCVWWKTFGKLAVVPCALQFVASIRSPGMKWEGRLQDKEKRKKVTTIWTSGWKSSIQYSLCRRESCLGHSLKILL